MDLYIVHTQNVHKLYTGNRLHNGQVNAPIIGWATCQVELQLFVGCLQDWLAQTPVYRGELQLDA